MTLAFALRGSDLSYRGRNYNSRALETYGPVISRLHVAQWLRPLFLPALGFTLVLAYRRRDFALAFLTFPVVYFCGIHSVTTHFLPRYSAPLVPILCVIFVLSVQEIYAGTHS